MYILDRISLAGNIFLAKLYVINLPFMSLLGLLVDLNLGKGNLLLGETRCFLPSHLLASLVVDLEELVDLFKGEARRLNVEVPDNRHEREVEDGKDNVKFPTNIGDTFTMFQ